MSKEVKVALAVLSILLIFVGFIWIFLPKKARVFPLPTAAEHHTSKYDRKEWSVWIDDDGDCQNTRTEILIRDAIAFTLSDNGCTVSSGEWLDPYSGERIVDPKLIDIDHVIPLEEASESGASIWDKAAKRTFANDLAINGNLLAVHRSVNRSKGAKSPNEWMPPDPGFACRYIDLWISLKQRWHMYADESESHGIQVLQDQYQCP